MGCRVGMAKNANLEARIEHWKKEEGYTHGKVLHRWKSYARATELEKEEGEARNCKHKPGGDPSDSANDWGVYHVWHH